MAELSHGRIKSLVSVHDTMPARPRQQSARPQQRPHKSNARGRGMPRIQWEIPNTRYGIVDISPANYIVLNYIVSL